MGMFRRAEMGRRAVVAYSLRILVTCAVLCSAIFSFLAWQDVRKKLSFARS